ncbi:MAG: type II secretion system inner membrane protein GspF [Pseudomonadota bacterium]
MAAFEYTALDRRGREKKGVLEGDTARQIRGRLRDQGWSPVSVEPVEERKGGGRGPRLQFQRGISGNDLAVVTRQLATLVSSGMPVESALATVGEQTERMRVRRVVLGVRSRILEGYGFAEALAGFPRVFPDLYRATVAAGEHAGHLDAILERLADYTENSQAVGQKLMVALIYPALVSLVAVGVVLVLLAYVVPEVVRVFEGMDQELPLLTRVLIGLSDGVRDWGPLIGLLLGLAAAAGAWILRREGPRLRFDRWLLRLPLIGRVLRALNAARFARTLAILADAGVPVLDGLRIAAEVVRNRAMRAGVEEAARRVREGSAISKALAACGFFPPLTIHLVASGEASGRLETMLERAADAQEKELEGFTAALMGLLEPILILVMGGVVLVIVLAILLPIFDMNQLVG